MLAEANHGRAPALVLGVQADDTPGMLEYARYAEALEPDAMIAIPPRTAASLADFRDYYARVVRRHRPAGLRADERRGA